MHGFRETGLMYRLPLLQTSTVARNAIELAEEVVRYGYAIHPRYELCSFLLFSFYLQYEHSTLGRPKSERLRKGSKIFKQRMVEQRLDPSIDLSFPQYKHKMCVCDNKGKQKSPRLWSRSYSTESRAMSLFKPTHLRSKCLGQCLALTLQALGRGQSS